MEEPNQNTAPPRDWESSGAASTSSSSVQVRDDEEEEERDERPPLLLQPRTGVSYNGHFPTADNDDDLLRSIRDDTWSWVVVVLTFWFFVSLTLILGVYGSVTLRLGPYCSLLIQSNHLFVKYVKVEELNQSKTSPSFYGFYQTPIPDVNTTWSENLDVCLPADFHKDWVYNLNEGSQINISYSVNSGSSSSLILIIAEGNEGFARWLENPSYPNTTLSWNIIRGSGLIQQDILTTSSYYVAVVNLNSEEMEVQLSLRVKAILYNTSDSYYTCNLAHGSCSLKLLFPFTNAALITTPGPEQDIATDEWYVKLSYGPRWITYLLGIGGMTVVIILVFHFLNYCRCTTEANRVQFGEMRPERTPLLSQKDDDLSSWGSSYESVSQDDEDPEDPEDSWAGVLLEGKPVKGGEYNNNTRRLCAICFDAPRDCFFLPCGHCVSCFACGTRIAELVGTCPICRRNMKKVRRIFTV